MPVSSRLQVRLDQLHVEQCEQERQGRLSALVLVDAIGVQAVAAATCARIVERQAAVVSAEESVEGSMCLMVPMPVAGQPVRFESC